MSLRLGHLHVTTGMMVVVKDEDGGQDLLKVEGIPAWDHSGTHVEGFLLWAGRLSGTFLPANEEFEVFA